MSLIDEIRQRGAAAILELEGRRENLELECKAKARPQCGKLDRSDRQNIGRELSAFCNSVGGVLLLGVRARPDADGIDEIIGFEPVAELRLFHSQVLDAVADLLMPRVGGIEVISVPDLERADAGYLAVVAPRAPHRPVRCEAPDIKQYFRRIGSTSRVMEHYEIEDAFRTRQSPELGIRYRVRRGTQYSIQNALDHEVLIDIIAENVSQLPARFPYIALAMDGITFRASDLLPKGSNSTDEHGRQVLEGGPQVVIYPGTTRIMATLAFVLSCPHGPAGPTVPVLQASQKRAARVAYGCLDTIASETQIEIGRDDWRHIVPYAVV